jgi:hypothetical protein
MLPTRNVDSGKRDPDKYKSNSALRYKTIKVEIKASFHNSRSLTRKIFYLNSLKIARFLANFSQLIQ